MQGTSKVTMASDVELIADAFREFVRVHQALLNILIGKAGILSTVPFVGSPIATILRELDKVVDTIAFPLIDLLEGITNDVKSEAEKLSGTIEIAIKSYDGLSVGKNTRRHVRDVRA